MVSKLLIRNLMSKVLNLLIKNLIKNWIQLNDDFWCNI